MHQLGQKGFLPVVAGALDSGSKADSLVGGPIHKISVLGTVRIRVIFGCRVRAIIKKQTKTGSSRWKMYGDLLGGVSF